MKLGPIHILRGPTYSKLSEGWARSRRLIQALSSERSGALLADAHCLQHSPLCARTAPAWILKPDADGERSRAAAERVVAAYQRVTRSAPPAPSMWDAISAQKRDFVAALRVGRVAQVRAALARMFQSPLVWGLGQVEVNHPTILRSDPRNFLAVRLTDTLVSLAEAVGALPVSCAEQEPATHMQKLDV